MNALNQQTPAWRSTKGLLAAAVATLTLICAPTMFAAPGLIDNAGNSLAGRPYANGESYIYAPNNSPTDISLSSSSVHQSAGVNAVVGTLATTDTDSGDSHTYSLVAGTGSTDNSSFNISVANLRANDASTLAPGNYSVLIQTDDGQGGTFQKVFVVNIVDDIAPVITSTANASATNQAAFTYAITASGGAVTFNASGLPSGLNVDTNSGVISGTPSQAGVFNANIMAADATGNAVTNALNLNVAKANATVVIGNLNFVYDGTGKNATAASTPEGLNVSLTYNGLTDLPTNAASYQVVGIISDSNYAGSETNTLVISKAPLSLQADDATRTFGQTNPVFTGTMTGNLPSDNLTLTFTCDATTTSILGTYPIVPGVDDPNERLANYNVSSTNGTLTVISRLFNWNIEPMLAAVQPTNLCAGTVADHIRVTAYSDPGLSYTVLVSSNLVTWSMLTNIVTDTNGTFEFMDWGLTNQSKRFFKAQQ